MEYRMKCHLQDCLLSFNPPPCYQNDFLKHHLDHAYHLWDKTYSPLTGRLQSYDMARQRFSLLHKYLLAPYYVLGAWERCCEY